MIKTKSTHKYSLAAWPREGPACCVRAVEIPISKYEPLINIKTTSKRKLQIKCLTPQIPIRARRRLYPKVRLQV